jgi:hypothetical protein
LSGSPFWPTLAALGFVLVNALVIVLGTRSTARYEFGRNRARLEEEALAAVAVPAAAAAVAAEEGLAAEEAALRRQVAVSVAAHPAGKLSGATAGWWLVAEQGDPEDLLADEPAAEVVAGPFTDRVDADWFALAHGLAAEAVYGARRAGGGEIVLRPSPEERAWLGELGDHLDRLGDEWDELLSDTDPVTTLAVEVAAVLVEAGLSLHDCAGGTTAGGVCLTPASGLSGLLVSWHQHERTTQREVRAAAIEAAQRTMSGAVADVLVHHGFAVRPLGGGESHLVTAAGP